MDLSTYADVSALAHASGTGAGSALGALLRASLGHSHRHVLRLRVEARLGSSTFIPGYFDVTYRATRVVAPVADDAAPARTKLELVGDLAGTPPRWGAFGELVYHYARRLSLGFSYEDGGALGEVARDRRYLARSVMLFAEVRHLYLPGSSRQLTAYVAYHLRNFDTLGPLLSPERRNELLFAALELQAYRALAVGLLVRKASPGPRPSGDALWDLLGTLSLGFEL
jgi:hypothetical protein